MVTSGQKYTQKDLTIKCLLMELHNNMHKILNIFFHQCFCTERYKDIIEKQTTKPWMRFDQVSTNILIDNKF